MDREGEKAAGDETWKVERRRQYSTSASRAAERALTFINVDRNLLAEKCCTIKTKTSRAEKNRQAEKKERKKSCGHTV